jgi:hypothetical protein
MTVTRESRWQRKRRLPVEERVGVDVNGDDTDAPRVQVLKK